MAQYLAIRRRLEENERRNQRRIYNELRDRSDPFVALEDEEFIKIFRLPKIIAINFINHVSEHIRETRGISTILRVLAVLQFCANGHYQRNIGRDYEIALSQPSVCRAIRSICMAVSRHLADIYISFPITAQEMTVVKRGFNRMIMARQRRRGQRVTGFPGVIGAIDCTHIGISPPPFFEDPHIFIDRRGNHSLNVEVICDADLKILGINATYPGSVHDSAIWTVSPLKQYLESEYYAGRLRGSWLLGDSGYGLQPWLLTPILDVADYTPEGKYTRLHSSARQTVERCIGLLKQRFRCLNGDRILKYSPAMAACIVNTCAVLHNLLVINNVDNEPPAEPNHDRQPYNEHDPQPAQGNARDRIEGRRVRAALVERLFAE